MTLIRESLATTHQLATHCRLAIRVELWKQANGKLPEQICDVLQVIPELPLQLPLGRTTGLPIHYETSDDGNTVFEVDADGSPFAETSVAIQYSADN